MEQKLRFISKSKFVCSLIENQLIKLIGGEGGCVECISGIVLITAYNEISDFEMSPGDVFIVPNNELVLIEAINGSGCVKFEASKTVGSLIFHVAIWNIFIKSQSKCFFS